MSILLDLRDADMFWYQEKVMLGKLCYKNLGGVCAASLHTVSG